MLADRPAARTAQDAAFLKRMSTSRSPSSYLLVSVVRPDAARMDGPSGGGSLSEIRTTVTFVFHFNGPHFDEALDRESM